MKTIDIRTTQNVSIEYELATVWERIVACFIDLFIVGIMYIIVILLLFSALQDNLNGMLASVIYSLLLICGFMIYQLISEVAANGQSWGKKSMGIKVVRLDGQEPSLSDYLLRSVFYLVDIFICFGILGILLIGSSAKSQRLGDMTANTTVIKTKHNLRFNLTDILRISTLEDYEPQYPEVRQLSERDMLLIKNTVTRYKTFQNSAHRQVIDQLVEKIARRLDITHVPPNKVEFLRTLIRDYIVLTR